MDTLLRHDDRQVRQQGLALLRALSPREAGEALSKLSLWKELPLEGLALEGIALRTGGVESCALQGSRLERALFWHTPLSHSPLHACILRGATLEGARALQIGLCNADLSNARLRQGLWDQVSAGRARMDGLKAVGWAAWSSSFCLASLRKARLERCELERCDLRGADLQGAVLIRTQVRGVDLRGATLQGVALRDCALRDIDLRGADLRDVDWSTCETSGVLVDEATQGTAPPGARWLAAGADLQEWQGAGLDLEGADLRGADLSRADLRGANLRNALLGSARLYCANLEDVDLRGADLREADLSGAMVAGANLLSADLQGASLRGTQVTGALCDEATRWPESVPAGVIRLAAGVRLGLLHLTEVDLSSIDLRDAHIESLYLEDVSLRGAQLTGLTCKRGWLRRVDLRGVDRTPLAGRDIHLLDVIPNQEPEEVRRFRPRSPRLRKLLGDQEIEIGPSRELSRRDLRGADLRGQDLRGAELEAADLRGADLREADLTRADLWGALIDEQTQADDREALRRSGAIEVPPGWRWAWRSPRLSPAPLAQAPAWADDAASIPLLPGMRIWVETPQGWSRTWQPPPPPRGPVQIRAPGLRRCVPDLGDEETFAMAATWLVLESAPEPPRLREPVTIERSREGWKLVTKEERFHLSLALPAAASAEQALAAMWRRYRDTPGDVPAGERYVRMSNPPMPASLRLSGRESRVAQQHEQEQERHHNRQQRWLQRLLRRFEEQALS